MLGRWRCCTPSSTNTCARASRSGARRSPSRPGLGVSSATIRNEMAALEELGIPLAPAHLGRPDPDRRRLPQVRGLASARWPHARQAAPRDRRLLRGDDARPGGGPEGHDPAPVEGDPVRGPRGPAGGLERGDPAHRAARGRQRRDAAGHRAARPRRQGAARPSGWARRGRARRRSTARSRTDCAGARSPRRGPKR